jgi:hypothetical protein
MLHDVRTVGKGKRGLELDDGQYLLERPVFYRDVYPGRGGEIILGGSRLKNKNEENAYEDPDQARTGITICSYLVQIRGYFLRPKVYKCRELETYYI